MNTSAESSPNLHLLLNVPVNLSVELGNCQMPMREVLQLTIGSVVQLDKLAETMVELSVNRKLFARGEVVVVDDRFGIKITEIVNSTPPT